MSVTVLMSVYNDARYLRQSIESVLDKNFADFEFIIVNDGSTDGTSEIIKKYDDPRFFFVQNASNIGLTKSLNIGLDLANGTYVARMDADDVCMPGRLAAQVRALERAEADVCFCRVLFEDEISGRTREWREADWDVIRWQGLFRNAYGKHPAVMFRREAILEMGGYNEHFVRAQDYDLWDRCAAQGLRFCYVPEPLVRYRLRHRGVSRQHLEEQEGYAREVSFRAIRRLLPDATSRTLRGLRWLFLRREHCNSREDIHAGLERCRELVDEFMQAYAPVTSRAVWSTVALSLASRLGEIEGQDRKHALSEITHAVKRSGSVRCLVRVVWAVVKGLKEIL